MILIQSKNNYNDCMTIEEFSIHQQDFIIYSNMTWFFSPIKSTDTNSALFPDISALANWQ